MTILKVTTMQQPIITETDIYRIEHASRCTIPGYLIIFVKPPANTLKDLDSAAQQQLTKAISNTIKIVEQIVKPERIYTLSFGEQTPRLHFHIFPRTKQMLADFNREFNRDLDYADGAEMFNWARQYYQQPTTDYLSAVDQINAAFDN